MSSDNTDIRQQVEADRGISKKLELLIPGLRGYRQFEDLRISDGLLRSQVADKLDLAKSDLEALRKQLVSNGDFANLTTLGGLISQVQQFSGEVRHSQQGYSGFGFPVRIDEGKLNELYEFDLDFVNSAFQLQDAVKRIVSDGTLGTVLSGIGNSLAAVKRKWALRMETIEKILVK
jgi:hypothetical protein